MKKVAFIQNRVQRGGRAQVMVHIIKILNDKGITPDVVTFKCNFQKEDAKEHYGLNVEFNIKEIMFNPKIPFEWNIPFFNKVVGSYLKGYDLVINSNNTSFLLNVGDTPLLTYIHFPRKARVLSSKKDIHFPEGEDKSALDFKLDFLLLAKKLYRFDTRFRKNEVVIANSEFTKSQILKYYEIKESEIEVIPPPVDIFPVKFQKKPQTFVSLGRFSPDKRQFEQIQMAQEYPHFTFTFIGFINHKAYYEKCENLIKSQGIKNVNLLGNASREKVEETLLESQFFIHTLRNEPFGITTVQAINYGCLPIVHNSGGQIEIVAYQKLRFDDDNELLEAVSYAGNLTSKEINSMVEKLKMNIQIYSTESFSLKFRTIVEKTIELDR